MSAFPSIDAQISSMRADYPAFKVSARGDNWAVWNGSLTPLMQRYEIEIAYRVPFVVEQLDLLKLQPRVRVLEPMLRPRRGDPEGELPHVYYGKDGPILCLFDPETAEWTPVELLSQTTVPYAIDWLVCYEGWRATGQWSGGGRHPATLTI